MIELLKVIVVTTLHDMVFGGSFPHFHGQRGDQLDLLTSSLREGVTVAVEISFCPAAGYRRRLT